jgi:bifunctional DNA-binding transcriptional regulator/antitoxin component of YhaV-PrlF toxin-antitoxin module
MDKTIQDVYMVQPYGKTGFCLTVPKKWAKKHGIEYKTPVLFTELPDGRLIIQVIKETT